METHVIPVISTAHITLDVNSRLDRNDNPWTCHATYEGCGFFIFLDEPSDHQEPVPQCLMDIRDWLLKQEQAGEVDNCRWVRLDCDADTVEGLPTYDW